MQQPKNKTPAPLQITAEQILREAHQFKETPFKPPKQIILDGEELQEFKLKKRREFEDKIRRNKTNVNHWIKYANWENSIKETERSRSIFERALDVSGSSPALWLHYCEMELTNKNINHTRNLLDRAVSILPRLNQLWYKYVWLEESLGNIPATRQVFERWIQWNPTDDAWEAYVKFEKRYKETNQVREIYKKWIGLQPQPKNWIKWAKFEEELGNFDQARQIYTECIDYYTGLSQQHNDLQLLDPNMFVSFAKFEQRREEFDRVKAIYHFAINLLGDRSTELRKQLTIFEKQHGTNVDDVVNQRRKQRYLDLVHQDPLDYDSWFALIKLAEQEYDASPKSIQDKDTLRDLFEQFISHPPPTKEKRHWKRYIWSWIMYAVWEELEGSPAKVSQIYQACLDTIPNNFFTFAKIWILYAQHFIRDSKLSQARRLLGMAIGKYPKEKLFKAYIALEIRLREFDRARKLYEKYLEWQPWNSRAWLQYYNLEKTLGDTDRARAILNLAIQQDLDMPEVVWKALIDFETEEEEWNLAREAYNDLLSKTGHVKVWLSFCKFEDQQAVHSDDSTRQSAVRSIYKKAFESIKDNDQRLVLLTSWKEWEEANDGDVTSIEAKMPKIVKKRRRLDNGQWEEYLDQVWPEEKGGSKLLQMAHLWKKQQATGGETGTKETVEKPSKKNQDEIDLDSDDESDTSSTKRREGREDSKEEYDEIERE